MIDTLEIMPATANDIPALCDLLAVLFAQEAEFTPDRDRQRSGLQAILDAPERGTILTARCGQSLVGMTGLLFTVSTALGGKVALLEDLVVMPEHRGQGIGSALLERAIELAGQNACRRITLLTDGDNLSAQKFYRRHGFEPSAMLPLRLRL